MKKSVVGTFKNICTVAVQCWYIKYVFAGFCQEILKKQSKGILGKIDKKLLSRLADFGYQRGEGLGESVKNGKFATKIFFR